MQRRDFLKFALVFTSFSKAFAFKGGANLFVYYSRTLNTHILASYLQKQLGGDLCRLHTKKNYPQDYAKMVEMARKQRQDNIFPALQDFNANLKEYESIFILSPLWGMDICAPIKSFLFGRDFLAKNVFLIITNAGYGLGNAPTSLKQYAKNARILGILDYEFKDYEKIKPNLLSLNREKIRQNKAFAELDKKKIEDFLKLQ